MTPMFKNNKCKILHQHTKLNNKQTGILSISGLIRNSAHHVPALLTAGFVPATAPARLTPGTRGTGDHPSAYHVDGDALLLFHNVINFDWSSPSFGFPWCWKRFLLIGVVGISFLYLVFPHLVL